MRALAVNLVRVSRQRVRVDKGLLLKSVHERDLATGPLDARSQLLMRRGEGI